MNTVTKPRKSTPSLVEVINRLLSGESLHHQTLIDEGAGHRLGITIHALREGYEFGQLIQCPRCKHPKQFHYFIDSKDLPKAREIAMKYELLREVVR
jgi:hypothetical protein